MEKIVSKRPIILGIVTFSPFTNVPKESKVKASGSRLYFAAVRRRRKERLL